MGMKELLYAIGVGTVNRKGDSCCNHNITFTAFMWYERARLHVSCCLPNMFRTSRLSKFFSPKWNHVGTSHRFKKSLRLLNHDAVLNAYQIDHEDVLLIRIWIQERFWMILSHVRLAENYFFFIYGFILRIISLGNVLSIQVTHRSGSGLVQARQWAIIWPFVGC